jgi:hypothetical protein
MTATTPEEEPGHEGVCGVCGDTLRGPVVGCPRCRAGHHPDCWTYNQGCAVYACGTGGAAEPAAESVAVTVPATLGEDALVEPEADVAFTLEPQQFIGVAVGGLVALLWLLGPLANAGEAVVAVIGASIALFVSKRPAPRRSLFDLEEEDDRRDEEALALEIKAVLAHMGGPPEELAHAYGLFEQRRPMALLPGEAQLEVGFTLAKAGNMALASEALEKCFRGRDAAKARAAYLDIVGEDPASFVEVASLLGAEERPLPAGPQPSGAMGYVLALHRLGFPLEHRREGRLPCDPEGTSPRRSAWVAGPLAPAQAEAFLEELRAAGCPALWVAPEEIALPDEVHYVDRLLLSAREASLEVNGQVHALPWEQVRAVLYEGTEAQEVTETTTTKIVIEHRSSRTERERTKAFQMQYETMLEVHVGEPLQRFRLRLASTDLFHYLGRRRALTHAHNLRLVAKDLVRFAPRARVSPGLLAMMSERQHRSRRARLHGPDEFEEFVRWWVALGSEAVRAWWEGARTALDRG